MASLLSISALFLASLHIIVALPAERNGDIKVAPPTVKPLQGKISPSKISPQKKPENDETNEENNEDEKPEEVNREAEGEKGKEGQEGEEEEREEEEGEEEEEEETDLNEEDDKDENDEKEDEDTAQETEEEEEKEEEAELNPILFEGDLRLSSAEVKNLEENTISKKDAIASEEKKWPNARVPYKISKKFAKDAGRMRGLRRALREFKRRTCVKFAKKKKSDKDYVKFVVERGCFSNAVGKKKGGGQQVISIGTGCTRLGTIIHEMMHAIGFFHEHTRIDRDQYVTIEWKNIQKKREGQFMKYGHGEADYLNEPYDYDSVMHYSRTGFGVKVNGTALPTIVPKDKPWREIGQRRGFSKIDLRQINKLYKCKKFTSTY